MQYRGGREDEKVCKMDGKNREVEEKGVETRTTNGEEGVCEVEQRWKKSKIREKEGGQGGLEVYIARRWKG